METVTNQSSQEAKIRLFRSLFAGREDVYPRRFENRRTGKAGYAPACANEWVRGVCEKPRVKCATCSNRRFLAVTDEVVRWHLQGCDDAKQPFVMGVYPMLLDEHCHFLAVDFDGEKWDEDAQAYCETCLRLDLEVALERSRSGNGAHVWFFFAQALPAQLARKLGSYVLTETADHRPDIEFGSYDRFFPNQDTLPKGGLGNLIALPLQRTPRDHGNSVFIDENLRAYPDQWQFLSGVQRISRARVEELTNEASRKGRILGVRCVPSDEHVDAPWQAPPSRQPNNHIPGPLPGSIDAVVGDQIYLEKDAMPPPLRNRVVRLAAFQNPEFYRAEAMRLPTYDKPRIIGCAEDLPKHVGMPRGCLPELSDLLESNGISLVIRDERFSGTPLNVHFRGELLPEQRPAANALLEHDIGVLAATTAFGKTVLAAWMIASRGVNTLILVHRQQLMEQWIERLSSFLGLSASEIGRLGAGKRKLKGRIDIALLQSMVRKGIVDDRIADYGHVIVDECHHISARSFELVARRAKAKFVLGLSATVTRKDGHHPIIFMQCGPVRYRVNARQQAAVRAFNRKVIVRPTAFRGIDAPELDRRVELQMLFDHLVKDDTRNLMICEDVRVALGEKRSVLVITERTNHVELLAGALRQGGTEVVTLQGGMGRKTLKRSLEKLAAEDADHPVVVVASGRFVGEGFDHPRLDTLFLALPVSWKGTIAQYAGRLHRLHQGKREVRIYDYADLEVPLLSRMFDRRCRGYEAVGYSILLPASALPGWPLEVPLPADSRWKRDYAASVRRLIRDGVDSPLADLFFYAARPFDPNAEGALRARSASEAFLYRRLQTLEATKDRFILNRDLPIAFEGSSSMEVDLVDDTAKIAIELDGPQHIGDIEAYRRDRTKDRLLQEHGFYVMRFLVEDVSTRLNDVLDAILRVQANRTRSRRE